jgi:hypothetical protein
VALSKNKLITESSKPSHTLNLNVGFTLVMIRKKYQSNTIKIQSLMEGHCLKITDQDMLTSGTLFLVLGSFENLSGFFNLNKTLVSFTSIYGTDHLDIWRFGPQKNDSEHSRLDRC